MSDKFVRQVVSVPPEHMREITRRLIELMNELQTIDRYPIDQVLLGIGYALGSALAQRGLTIDGEDTIEDGLHPVLSGYRHAIQIIEKDKQT